MERKFSDLPQVQRAWNYPLFEALFNRRSRRFGLGMEIKDGPNKFKSDKEPIPLSPLEEALLVAGATGISGLCLADIPHCLVEDFPDKTLWCGGGNTMIQYTGRTWPSPCGSHGTELFFTNDSGLYMVKLKDVEASDILEIQKMSDRDKIVKWFHKHTLQLQKGRLEIPRSIPALFNVNLWDTNLPGATLFMPISDMTWEFINGMFLLVEQGFNLIDEQKGYRPCGTEKWVKKGLLREDLPATLGMTERLFGSVIVAEGAFISQNLMLVIQAMGLGGWVFSGFTPLIALGGTPVCKGLGFRFVTGKDGIPTPVGLDGHMEAYCPPYYKNMNEAVDAIIEAKWGEKGIFSPTGPLAPYKEKEAMDAGIPKIKQEAVTCVKDICNYIYDTYGRFPAFFDAINMSFWVQAQHIEMDFYDKYYKEGAYTQTQKEHMELWHSEVLSTTSK